LIAESDLSSSRTLANYEKCISGAPPQAVRS
jgi:hypothetical protein